MPFNDTILADDPSSYLTLNSAGVDTAQLTLHPVNAAFSTLLEPYSWASGTTDYPVPELAKLILVIEAPQ